MEIGHIKDYSVFLLRAPYRMVIDVYAQPNPFAATTTAKNSAPPQNPKAQDKAQSKKPANAVRKILPRSKTPASRKSRRLFLSRRRRFRAVTNRRKNKRRMKRWRRTSPNVNRLPDSRASRALPQATRKFRVDHLRTDRPQRLQPPRLIPKSAAPAPSKTNYLKTGHSSGVKMSRRRLRLPFRAMDSNR